MELMEQVINETLAGLSIYVRDQNLEPKFEEEYRKDTIIREKGFTDASSRNRGIITTHRIAILSNHMMDLKDFDEVASIQDEILADYADDFSKHAPLSEIEKIRWIWESVPKQLAKENNKFVFSHVKAGKRAHELEEALQWLKNAGLIYMIELVKNAEIPLSANADASYFKVYMADTGLLSRRLGISYKSMLGPDVNIKTLKGAVVENYVLNELINNNKKPFFWRSGNIAELDFLCEEDGEIVPIEVKAATNTRAKSYRQFCKKYDIQNGFKFSLKNIAQNDCEGVKTLRLPLYLVWNMDYYCMR